MTRETLLIVSVALLCAGCPSSADVKGDKPEPKAPPAIFTVIEGEARLLAGDGTMLASEAVGFEGYYSTWRPGLSGVFVAGAQAVYEVPLMPFGKAREVGRYPALGNKCIERDRAGEYIQSPWGLGLDEDGAVCVRLQDRNDNMMDTAVVVRVPVGGEAPEAVTVIDAGECAEGEVGMPPCVMSGRGRWTAGAGDKDPIEVDSQGCRATIIDSGEVLDFKALGLSECPDSFEGSSITGRYAAFSVPTESGDYIYRRFMIVDLESRALVEGFDREISGETGVSWSRKYEAVIVGGELMVMRPEPKAQILGGAAIWLE